MWSISTNADKKRRNDSKEKGGTGRHREDQKFSNRTAYIWEGDISDGES